MFCTNVSIEPARGDVANIGTAWDDIIHDE